MTIRTEIAEISYDEQFNILHIDMIDGSEMNLENTIAHYQAIEELTHGKRHRVLINSSRYYTVNTESFNYSAQTRITGKRIALAHYDACLANKFLLKFYKINYQPPVPLKVFNTREDAIAWLCSVD